MKLLALSVLVLLFCFCFSFSSPLPLRRYGSIFSFGDSYTDTGNLAILSPESPAGHVPYGKTFFGHPNGRCSDGRLVIDFVAEALGLPLIPPYFGHDKSFRKGANFAVGGATTLDLSFFQSRGILSSNAAPLNISLDTQLGWFQQLKPTLCNSTKDCRNYFGKSLFVIGEFGINDYQLGLFATRNLDEVRSYAPQVIKAISTASERLIDEGAKHIVVASNPPTGCNLVILAAFQSPNGDDYDRRTGCLKKFDDLARYHNELLRQAVAELGRKYPSTKIIYADYYSPVKRLAHSPKHFGFSNGALRACCGGGGPYNVSEPCGSPDSSSCNDPSTYVNWDGVHLTEAAYSHIATGWLNGSDAEPFGDSLADTGNLLLSGALPFPSIGHLPYGITFFRHPTGRCSDGRLIVDFIAEAFGLPMLPPYLARGADFRHGANFAVGGATALDPEFLQEIGVGELLWTNNSLSAQLRWFEELLPLLCNTTKDCRDYFSASLFLVGEIGGNDYNYGFSVGKSMEEIRSYVPNVTGAIATATERLINNGAIHLMVPGNLPFGCSSVYLTLFGSVRKADYDRRNGCLKKFNSFAKYHNALLRRALARLQRKYQRARIIYADYYGAAIPFSHAPKHFGEITFKRFTHGALTSCCGGGGPYNFNPAARCGHQGSSVCSDPSSYANWDG
ncbi:GDSL esterase/lipase, partial [Ananas comosus]